MMLYLVRHAWAGRSGDPRYPDDSLRPLTEKGRKRFRRFARKLAKRDFSPAIVATSRLTRAYQTAEILAAELEEDSRLETLDDLAPGGRLQRLVDWTREQLVDSLAWVSHSPDLDHHAAALIGGGGGRLRFEKGAVAAIRFDDAVEPGAGELRWLVTADLFRC